MAIITMLNVWNDFIWPSIVISDNARKTITTGLISFQGTYMTNYGPLMAGYVLAAIPLLILFFIFMKHFVEGLTAGSAKG
jgi:multiple sugar transport system permease protein/raffinose/stachyose/melibiose transport system permease protein